MASHAAPSWPFGADGAILLVNDGADAPLEVQVRPRGSFDCSFDAEQGVYAITRRGATDAQGEPVRLLMKVERALPVASAAPKKAAVWKTRTAAPALAPSLAPAPAQVSDQTAVPFSHRPASAAPIESEQTFAPVAQQRVSLVGLALPRLSRYRDTGAVGIEIALDRALGVAAEGRDSPIAFDVDADDRLHALTGAGREEVNLPATFHPVGQGKVELVAVPPAMAERYCATLLLPKPASMAVAAGARLVFGRAAPMLSALRVLDSPRFLRTGDGAPLASADRIGLSRNAFSFEAVDGGYRIARMSATQALFHLDASLAFVAVIGDSAAPGYLLPHGHHLVAGHYVLRFDA